MVSLSFLTVYCILLIVGSCSIQRCSIQAEATTSTATKRKKARRGAGGDLIFQNRRILPSSGNYPSRAFITRRREKSSKSGGGGGGGGSYYYEYEDDADNFDYDTTTGTAEKEDGRPDNSTALGGNATSSPATNSNSTSASASSNATSTNITNTTVPPKPPSVDTTEESSTELPSPTPTETPTFVDTAEESWTEMTTSTPTEGPTTPTVGTTESVTSFLPTSAPQKKEEEETLVPSALAGRDDTNLSPPSPFFGVQRFPTPTPTVSPASVTPQPSKSLTGGGAANGGVNIDVDRSITAGKYNYICEFVIRH
jgi:hypothetical protein